MQLPHSHTPLIPDDHQAPVTVLVIDDHPLFRRGIVELVDEQRGYEVVADLDSGATLIAMLEQHQPQLVLLDLNLPDISGLTLLERIKQHKADTKVVMITASEQDSDLFQALSLGANGYLMKDTAPDEMISRIEQAMTGQIALNEHSVTLLAQSLQAGNQPHPGSEPAGSPDANSHSHGVAHSHGAAQSHGVAQAHGTASPEIRPSHPHWSDNDRLSGNSHATSNPHATGNPRVIDNNRASDNSHLSPYSPATSQPVTPSVDLTTRERQTLALISKGLNNKLIARELGISDGTVKVYVKSLLRKLNLHSRLELAAWVHQNPDVIRNPF